MYRTDHDVQHRSAQRHQQDEKQASGGRDEGTENNSGETKRDRVRNADIGEQC